MPQFRMTEWPDWTCYHEAGHVVGSVAAGNVRPESVNRPASALCDAYPTEVRVFDDGTGYFRLSGFPCYSVEGFRRRLIAVVAGPLAEFLYRSHEDGDDQHDLLLSNRIRDGETGDSTVREDDLVQAFHYGNMISELLPTSTILGEVIRAERWAGRLLQRRWASVEAIADALMQSESGELWSSDIQKLYRG